eukprot:280101-Ditylum_brightwellii.AAC.1
MEIAGTNLASKTKPGDGEKGLETRFRLWQFENKEGKEILDAHNRTYCWCTNNCHPKPMSCTQPNCLSRTDFATKMAKEKDCRGGDVKKGESN